jgi:hypothetical protein
VARNLAAPSRSREGGREEQGCLLIADISGYTGYVTESPLEYAEDVLVDATETVVGTLEGVLRVNKLEGDAVFAYGLDGEIDGSLLLDLVEQCYFAFRARLRGIEHSVSCECPACAKISDLNLKLVAHHGSFIRRSVASSEELTGRDVILVHRLLKNTVAERFGHGGYAILSEPLVAAYGIDPVAAGMVTHEEVYPDVGAVGGYVLDLDARWETERERSPVYVDRSEAGFEIEVSLAAEPALAWDFLTSPGKRSLWQGESLQIDESAPGGRRGVGTTCHCVDVRSTVYEEVLDWRPFQYFTERKTLGGSVKVVLTTELEPVETGSRLRVRGARLRGRERVVWLAVGPGFRRRLTNDYERLAELLRATRITRPLPLVTAR